MAGVRNTDKRRLRGRVIPLVLGGLLAASSAGAAPSDRAQEACTSLLAERPEARETARCFYRLANPPRSSETARTTVEDLAAERPDLPWFTYYLGNLTWRDPESAQVIFRDAAGAFSRAGDLEGEVLARISRAQLLSIYLGRMAEAQAEIDKVLEISRGTSEPKVRAWRQITLAGRLIQQGDDMDRAYRVLREMEVPPEMDGGRSLEENRVNLLAYLCLETDRLDEAARAYDRLLTMARETDDSYLEAGARYGLASVEGSRLVEVPTAEGRRATVDLAREAMRVATDAGHRSVEALSARIVGTLTPGEEGRRFLEHCLDVAETASLRSYCLGALGRHLLEKEPEKAKSLIEKALVLAREADDGWSQIYAWPEMMRVQWQTLSAEEALEESWSALKAIESLRDQQETGSRTQAGMFSLWSDDYAWLAGRLLEAAEREADPEWALEQAFRVAERMRSRALIDWLQRAKGVEERVPEIQFRTVAEVQDALRGGEALLSFQVAPWQDFTGAFGGGSWLLLITRDEVTVHRLPGRVEVRRDVRLFEGLIGWRDGAEVKVAAGLYEKLLAPALAELPPEVDRLILVPDDALHRLPFAALRPAPEAEPLGARYELVRAPSATLWLRWREHRAAPAERPLLVLADPDLPGPGDDGAADAEGAAGEPQMAELGSAAVFRGETLGRLRHARREGKAAVRALGGGRLLVGPEASEAAFLEAGPGDFGLIHFAAHAVTDEDRPERSAVLLAAGGARTSDDDEERSGKGESAGSVGADAPRAAREVEERDGSPVDGRLEAAEIAHLDLEGRTVVLASCRSADGAVLRGEGVMSLARAFFQAGSHGVVASLWPLRDDESAALFGRFYELLADGATVSEALHGARRTAIEAGAPAAAWAGVVVLGEGRTAPLPGASAGVGWWVPAGAAAVLVIVLVAVVVVRRRR